MNDAPLLGMNTFAYLMLPEGLLHTFPSLGNHDATASQDRDAAVVTHFHCSWLVLLWVVSGSHNFGWSQTSWWIWLGQDVKQGRHLVVFYSLYPKWYSWLRLLLPDLSCRTDLCLHAYSLFTVDTVSGHHEKTRANWEWRQEARMAK